ncbi:PAS domain-containing sensor histidine kinase [Solirubrobacter ginsenosidimutans]|uniref:PAS domain-containing sensor histidine kinase n=1 Tax=Solirubrobacter ginsenosidimutans TaxID=490573 RepID=UPI0022CDD39E|nr:PAS domain S-box protein [Solirubrobacter ginsenosidimutans]
MGDVFDLAHDLIVIVGFDGRFERVNPAFERTLGYPFSELLSRSFLELIHPDDIPWLRHLFDEFVRGDRDDMIGIEHRVVCRDGSVRWLQSNSRVIPERGLVFAVARDVTDRRLADAELAASRARIVAAADDERRRVVRDLHDGAQARLVHTIITLKLARRAVENGADDAPDLLREALDNAERAKAELRELAHGILPAALTRGGLHAAVEMLASRTPVPVENDVSVGRLSAAVEATAYFVVAEALTNIAKHAGARHAEVMARITDGTLSIHVRDDGIGGAAPDGSGLIGLADRLAALGGRLRVESRAGGGTLIAADIPVPA